MGIVKAIRKSTGLDISDDDVIIKDINEKGEIEFSVQVKKGDNDDNVKSVENALGNRATTNDILDEYKKDLEDIFDEGQLKDLALDTDVTSNGGAEQVTQSGDFVDPSTGGAGSDPNIDVSDDFDKDKNKDEDDECDGDDCVAVVDSAGLHSTSAALVCIIIVRMLLGNLHVAWSAFSNGIVNLV